MTFSRRNIMVAAIVLIVVALALFAWNAWQQFQAQKVQVVAAAVDIPKGALIADESWLTWREVNARDAEADPNVYRNMREVIGMAAVSDIPAGVVLLRPFLAERVEPGRALGTGQLVGIGKRAVPVEATLLQVIGGELAPGDHVDIYRSELVTRTTGSEEANPVSALAPTVVPMPDGSLRLDYKLLFADVKVVGLYDEAGMPILGKAQGRAVTVVFELAAEEDAETLLEAATGGSIRVVLLGYEQP